MPILGPYQSFTDSSGNLSVADARWVAVAAPRGHAKSTAGNHAYILANLLFGNDDSAIILSSTERMAVAHLKLIKDALLNNLEMMRAFNAEVVRDVETELVRVKGPGVLHHGVRCRGQHPRRDMAPKTPFSHRRGRNGEL